MKKIIIILALIFGLTKLTSAENAPVMNFDTFMSAITPKASLFDHRHLMNAYKHPLLPHFLKTPEITSALEKYIPQPISLAPALGKAALMTSAAAIAATAAYGIYYYFSPAPRGIDYAGLYTYTPAEQAVHSPRIGIDVPITHLELTLTIQKNGWLAPVTITIKNDDDDAGYDAFLTKLQRNLTLEEREETGETGETGNTALLQQNNTYTFTISGNVTYRNRERYELQEEQVIATTQGRAGHDAWIAAFWKKNIATRIASVWPELPYDLIDDHKAIYHAVISDTNTQEQLRSLSVAHKEDFKEQVIQALANEISATTIKQVEIKISVTTEKDHFALAPLQLAIDSPGSNVALYEGLQHFTIHPAFRAAQIAYATQLWNIACESACARIVAMPPVTTQEKISTGVIWFGIGCATGLAIKKLEDADLLRIAVRTGMGIAAFTQMRTLSMKYKALYR